MSEAPTPRPAPVVTELGRPFWDACAEGRLVVQRCSACDRLRHYPQERCPDCHADAFDWAELSGRGAIYSYTVTHRAFHPAWADRVPYVVATIELDEGVRMVSELLDVPASGPAIGQRVEVVFEPLEGFGALPLFRVAD